jgi:hypothetical protein
MTLRRPDIKDPRARALLDVPEFQVKREDLDNNSPLARFWDQTERDMRRATHITEKDLMFTVNAKIH